MSLTLATVAEALIEFILSLLRDPAAAAEFEEDPEGMLAQRGLSQATAADVSAVAPVIIERSDIVHAKPAPVERVVIERPAAQQHDDPVVREITQVTSHFQWVDDRDTLVDQSVNQNIWADGDVTQHFDNEAIVASGDDALAAGDDIEIDETTDRSTTIEAGEDVNLGNDTDVTVIEDSFGEETDASQATDSSAEVDVDGSGNDSGVDVDVDGSGNDTTTETVVEETVSEVATAVPNPAEPGPAQPASEHAPGDAYDSAAEYSELSVDVDQSAAFASQDDILPTLPANDDDL